MAGGGFLLQHRLWWVDEQVSQFRFMDTNPEHLQPSWISRGSPGGQQVSVSEETSMTGALALSQPAAGTLPPLLPPSVGEAQQLRLYHVFLMKHLKQSDSLLRKANFLTGLAPFLNLQLLFHLWIKDLLNRRVYGLNRQ